MLAKGGTAGITAWEEGVRYRGLCFAYSERSGWPALLKDVKLWADRAVKTVLQPHRMCLAEQRNQSREMNIRSRYSEHRSPPWYSL